MLRRALSLVLVAAVLPAVSVLGGSSATAAISLPSGASRWEGLDRYTTAATVVHNTFPTSQTVYIASGANFPDALAGGPLAGGLGAPILLTAPMSLSPATNTALTILKPSRIVILGGVGAVSAEVETGLHLFADDVQRIGGADRYAVAADVSARNYPVGAPAYIASGENFPDALSGAPVAARRGAPILLTRQSSLPGATVTELERLKPSSITVLGGAGAVSDDVLATLQSLTTGAVSRVGGADRYAVSTALAGPASQGADTVFVASGSGYADALAGAPSAVRAGAPILLTGRDALPASVLAWLQEARPSHVVVLGGAGVVSDAVYADLHAVTGSTSPVPSASPWLSPETAGHDLDADLSESQVALDRSGAALVVWTRTSQSYPYTYVVQARRRTASGAWGAVTSVSAADTGSGTPGVAVDDDGDAVVAWNVFDGTDYHVYARRLSRTGTLGPLLILSRAGMQAADPSVAVDPDGDAIIAWHEIEADGSYIPLARQLSSAGTLGATIELRDGYARAFHVSAVIDREGDALVAWDNDNTVQARTISSSGVVSPLKILNGTVSPIDSHYVPRAAIDADGDAVVMWRYWRSADLSTHLMARAVASDGTLGTLHELTPEVSAAYNFALASDLEGDVVFTWVEEKTEYVYARRLSRAGVLGPPELVGIGANLPQIDMDDDGDGVVTFSDGDTVNGKGPCQARRFSSGGTWGSARLLTGCAVEARVAVDAGGRALTIYRANFDGNNRPVGASWNG